jgi:hypothetical protein
LIQEDAFLVQDCHFHFGMMVLYIQDKWHIRIYCFNLEITFNFVQDICILARRGVYPLLFKLFNSHMEILDILQWEFFTRFKVVHLNVEI